MRLSGDGVASATLLSLLFPLSAAAAGTIDCANIVADKHTFDLSKLDGPHSVIHSVAQPPSSLSTTYTINICKPLVPAGDRDEKESCPGPTQVCAIERLINPIEKTNSISRVIPIAGDLQGSSGSALEPSFTRLKTSTSPSDQGLEGLRIVLNGGSYSGRKQRAIVDLLCDKAFTGVEGEVEPEDKYKHEKRDETPPAGNATALRFINYGAEGVDAETDILRLEWKTKYACESLEEDGKVTSHWGFFTWFIIIAFMGTAAYLIFGSWLNYNRYGARGWDLLPHGDTIRDVPYLLKDWSRRVFSTVQGSGSRGGYSAV